MVAYKKRVSPQLPHITPQEHLERERKAETKSEYYAGVIVAMTGASWEHNLITSNIQGELHSQLRGMPCAVVTSDLRVEVRECHAYFYPDVVAVYGEPEFADAELDTLLNPTLIVEVLSESTEAMDRGKKWTCYQSLKSLQTYVLVSQDRPYVEAYRRQADDWRYSTVEGLGNSLSLEAIGCTLKLADIYDRVEFPQGEAANEADSAPNS
ncbi:MAG TPA: Uma2 family endonuclease [Chthonomonadaceae bacterium]|nr:Uma2 family endonuclease [Chthonomonadaceae bacterium]